MKKNLLIGVIMGILFTSAPGLAATLPWEAKLPFKSGTIHYTVTGTGQGTQTLYFKDYGRTTAEYRKTTMKIFGMVQTQEEIDITTPDWVYSIDMATHTATKSVNPEKYMAEEYKKLSSADKKKFLENTEKLGFHALDGMQTTVEKKGARLLGYDCDVITMDMGIKVYTIADTPVPLKTESNVMGIQNNVTATKIEKGKVPASKFELPPGIQVETDEMADSMARQMARTVVESMVAGKMPASPSGNAPMGGDAPEGMPSPEQMQQLMEMFKGQEQ